MEPELYTEAAEILRKAREKKATLKTLIYASKYKNIRQLFALVSECNKHREIIEEVLSGCTSKSVVTDLAGGSKELAHVLLFEYLLGRKFGRDVSMRKTVQEFKKEITSSVEHVLQKYEAKTLAQAAQKMGSRTLIHIPRYMRVNLIKSTVEEAVAGLVSEGWTFVGRIDIDKFSETAKSLEKWQFGLDPLLFDLLVFPIGTDFHDHYLTLSGVLVQQDRASCVPAHVLNPEQGSVMLDCCSAPGNKTSHLASLTGDTGRIIALDRDHKRMATMSRLLDKSGATCVEMIVQDFLTVRPDSDDARDIRFILVDPSCSGSGMLETRTDQNSSDNQRLQTLQRFQISVLKHALRFPAVERVVYSTCSIHAEENEQVVEEVLAQVSQFFQFRPALPLWKGSRGLDVYPFSEFFIRLSPERDLTQGFFVACFERIKHQNGAPPTNGDDSSGDNSWTGEDNGEDEDTCIVKTQLEHKIKANSKRKITEEVKSETATESNQNAEDKIKKKKKRKMNEKTEEEKNQEETGKKNQEKVDRKIQEKVERKIKKKTKRKIR